MGKQRKLTDRQVFASRSAQVPRFSSSFVNEVRACADVKEFVDLMEARGVWLNRNAAEGVYLYLRSLGKSRLSDDELGDVSGGAPNANPLEDPVLQRELANLADQLGKLG